MIQEPKATLVAQFSSMRRRNPALPEKSQPHSTPRCQRLHHTCGANKLIGVGDGAEMRAIAVLKCQFVSALRKLRSSNGARRARLRVRADEDSKVAGGSLRSIDLNEPPKKFMSGTISIKFHTLMRYLANKQAAPTGKCLNSKRQFAAIET
jgi:hypothetical protein